MSLYVDTSCFMKILFPEPESDRVVQLLSGESQVIVSALTRVEALVQITGRELGRAITRRDAARTGRSVATLLATPPFESVESPVELIRIAEQQIRAPRGRGHCRMLDRLHLAAMEGLGLRRLLTNDDQQAGAARALGFDVLMPR
jgi:predicted nucleic acid-binding protein